MGKPSGATDGDTTILLDKYVGVCHNMKKGQGGRRKDKRCLASRIDARVEGGQAKWSN